MNLVPFRSPDMTTRLDYNKTMTSLLTILASSAEIGIWEPDLLVRRQSDLNLKLLWRPELDNSENYYKYFSEPARSHFTSLGYSQLTRQLEKGQVKLYREVKEMVCNFYFDDIISLCFASCIVCAGRMNI